MNRPSKGLAALLLASALGLAACAPAAPSSSEAEDDATQTEATTEETKAETEGETTDGGEDVTLKVWSWRTEDVAAYNKIFDVFEAQNPGITVEFEAFQNTEYNQVLTTGLAGSDGPDVPMVRSYGGLQPLVEAGQLEPLDDKVAALGELSPGVLSGSMGVKDGKIYAVPLATNTLQIFYNKAIFAENGLKPPTTWDEFISLNDKLLVAGVTPMALGAKDDWVLPIFADIIGASRYGGAQFEADVLAGKKDFNDPDYVASLELVAQMKKYLDKDVVGVSYTDSQVQFVSGQAAQFPGGSWELATFRDQAPDLDLGVYTVPLPPDAVASAPVVPGFIDGNFGVNVKSEHKEAAYKLVNWMATAEFGQLLADELNRFSAMPGVEYKDEVMQQMWAPYEANMAPYLLLVDFRYGDPSGTAVLGKEIQRMFLGETDAKAAAATLQDGVSQWFKPKS